MLLSVLAQTSQSVAGTRARREKIDHLARCLAELDPHEVRPAVAFLSGELRCGDRLVATGQVVKAVVPA